MAKEQAMDRASARGAALGKKIKSLPGLGSQDQSRSHRSAAPQEHLQRGTPSQQSRSETHSQLSFRMPYLTRARGSASNKKSSTSSSQSSATLRAWAAVSRMKPPKVSSHSHKASRQNISQPPPSVVQAEASAVEKAVPRIEAAPQSGEPPPNSGIPRVQAPSQAQEASPSRTPLQALNPSGLPRSSPLSQREMELREQTSSAREVRMNTLSRKAQYQTALISSGTAVLGGALGVIPASIALKRTNHTNEAIRSVNSTAADALTTSRNAFDAAVAHSGSPAG